MSTRKARNEAYRAELEALGKDLARRARSRCELSGATGPLTPFDLDPSSSLEPTLDRVVLVTRPLAEQLGGGAVRATELRFLEEAVWSSLPPVREAAGRLLARIDEPWARAAQEHLETMRDTDPSS